ncbi:chorismate mutase [Malassezia pachydermatis]|uniref:chorismate mutase n=1 Tax=Malassezia pachydermatis TaxID=77020 RepID=A0A0M8MVR1_9BASI|nr:chorismate mutase [Malassezia pachydermatis]KOS14541.1 chorismate mutase [Malassezia pachydermatis]
MHNAINFHNASVDDILSLDKIRASLQRMEESIVFRVIERAQYSHNARMYEEGAFPELREKEHWTGTWLMYLIQETESMPDEHPFTSREHHPSPILRPLDYPQVLHPHHVNVSKEILDFYVNDTVPRVTSMHGDKSDDGNYGSAAMCDIDALGSIARRIYFGMFVSEAKFRADPAAFIPHIQSRNAEALAALITKPAVEKVLLARVAQKAEVYGQDLNQTSPDPSSMQRKIDAGDIVRLYEDFIIPLTKKVEVDYLLERSLDGLSEAEVATLAHPSS